MKAISYSEPGPASSVLTLVDRPMPVPGPGEVLVQVAVSGVNPTDWKSRSSAAVRFDGGQVPNQDGAGTVIGLGDGVTGLREGDRVWLWEAAYQRPDGTAQQFLTIPARQAVLLPDAVSFDVGASLGIPALTAHRALTVAEGGPSRLAPDALGGVTVLVAGGAGAVGHAAIQLARWAGATVISTVSGPEKAALATAAGAHHVVDYKHSDAAADIRDYAPGGVNLIVEVAPAVNAQLDSVIGAPNVTIAVYANDGPDEMTVPIRAHMTTNTRYQFVLVYTVTPAAKAEAVAAVTAAVVDGVLPVGPESGLPLTRFPLADTAAAHDAVEHGTVGKVLIDVEQ